MDKIEIIYSKHARKFLYKQDKETKARIVKAIRKIPTGKSKISTLQGYPNLLKIRIGEFRVLFDKDYSKMIDVQKIGNRGEIYKELRRYNSWKQHGN